MKWILIVIGVIVVLILIVQMWGMMLSRTHTASRAARFNQKPETIFATITDWRSFPAWRGDLKSVRERQGEAGRTSWVEVSKMGEMPLEVIELDPPRRMVSKIADPGQKLPFGGTWTWDVKPDGDGCIVTVTEDGEIRPAFFRLMAKYIFGYTGTMDSYLMALAKKFGEDTQFVR
jgi:uncharacterized protein YndB with AHSA1/START domain